MINRYREEIIAKHFEEKARFEAFLRVEIAALKALEDEGIVPKGISAKIEKNARIDLTRIKAHEKETKHDVIAFTRAVCETLQDEKRWFHHGLTSTDIVDSAQSLILKQVNTLLLEKMIAFKQVLKKLAYDYQHTPCIGRTHGIHAEVTSFGLKFALYYEEFNRHQARFEAVRKRIEIGKLSGAVGNFSQFPPHVQSRFCHYLGLESARISTQTLQRDRHAEYIALLALIATSIEKIALEVRHLQRTEVNEVQEPFSTKQKGSSAMPHKRNPIVSENMSGIARIMRMYIQPSYENVLLWHERDISHSSAERLIFPDATGLLYYMLNRYAKTLTNLVVHTDQMSKNIEMTKGVIFSQHVLHALTLKGLAREDAYDLIQPIAFTAQQQNQNFETALKNNHHINQYLTDEEIECCFDIDYHLRHVGQIFESVFKDEN